MNYWLICRPFDDINTVPLTSTIMCSYEVIGVATNDYERETALRDHPGAKAMVVPRIFVPHVVDSVEKSLEKKSTVNPLLIFDVPTTVS